MFSCEYCEIFKNTYFKEHLQTAASREIRYEIAITLYYTYKQLRSSLFLSGCRSGRSLTFSLSGFTPLENNLLQTLFTLLRSFSLHQFYYSFYHTLFYLHSAFFAEVSQRFCKPKSNNWNLALSQLYRKYQIAGNTEWNNAEAIIKRC